MAQFNEVTSHKTFTSGSTMARYLRVMTASGVVVAGATDVELGVVMAVVTVSGDPADVLLASHEGTTPMVASAAITAGSRVYGAAGGKVSSTANSNPIGIALTAAGADNDVIEVLRLAGGEATDLHEIVITTNVITADENGKTFYLNLAGGFTSTLPAPFLGGRFKFVVKTAPTTAYIITTTSSANILYGMMLERAGTAGVAGAARDTFNFVANQAIIGDWVEFWSDGTNWYYHGMVDVAAGNTVAAT